MTLIVAALAQSSVASQPSSPRIDGFEIQRNGARFSISFRVLDGLSDDAVERVRSGMTVRYRHRVDITVRRSVPLWPARTLARGRIDASVSYDPLTRSYQLVRTADLKAAGGADATQPSSEERRTDSIEEVRRWMTEVVDLPLEVPVQHAGSRLRVRVETTMGRRYALYLFPTRHAVSAERKLEP